MLGDGVTVLLTLLKLPGDTSEFIDISMSTQSDLLSTYLLLIYYIPSILLRHET